MADEDNGFGRSSPQYGRAFNCVLRNHAFGRYALNRTAADAGAQAGYRLAPEILGVEGVPQPLPAGPREWGRRARSFRRWRRWLDAARADSSAVPARTLEGRARAAVPWPRSLPAPPKA